MESFVIPKLVFVVFLMISVMDEDNSVASRIFLGILSVFLLMSDVSLKY